LRQLDLILFGWFSNRDTIIYPTYYILPLFSRPQDGIIVWLKICRSLLAGTGYGKWAETGHGLTTPQLDAAILRLHCVMSPFRNATGRHNASRRHCQTARCVTSPQRGCATPDAALLRQTMQYLAVTSHHATLPNSTSPKRDFTLQATVAHFRDLIVWLKICRSLFAETDYGRWAVTRLDRA